MPQPNQYVAILRCQSWNVWPEASGTEHRPFSIDFGNSAALPTRLIVLSYAPRSAPERYVKEETNLGPLLWDVRHEDCIVSWTGAGSCCGCCTLTATRNKKPTHPDIPGWVVSFVLCTTALGAAA